MRSSPTPSRRAASISGHLPNEDMQQQGAESGLKGGVEQDQGEMGVVDAKDVHDQVAHRDHQHLGGCEITGDKKSEEQRSPRETVLGQHIGRHHREGQGAGHRRNRDEDAV
jgi:hypothetical protein